MATRNTKCLLTQLLSSLFLIFFKGLRGVVHIFIHFLICSHDKACARHIERPRLNPELYCGLWSTKLQQWSLMYFSRSILEMNAVCYKVGVVGRARQVSMCNDPKRMHPDFCLDLYKRETVYVFSIII